MKRAMKITTAVILIVTMLIFMPVNAQLDKAGKKQADIPKEELIYVRLNADGSARAAYVVNAFELLEPGAVTDYGDYSSVMNLTTTDTLSFSDGTVHVDAPAGRFYYQGNLKTVSLPWIVEVAYLLDNRQMAAKDMAGVGGQVEIRLCIRQNPQADGASQYFAKRYALQISLTLDAALCTGIRAEGATIASAGRNKLVSFIKLPGADADYSVTMNTTGFKMAGIQLSGIPLAIDLKLDTEKLAVGLADFSKGVGELDRGAQILRDGAKELREGAGGFLAGLKDMQDGMDKLTDGFDALTGGNAALLEGSAQMAQALGTFRERMAGFDAQAMDLTLLAEGSSAIYEAVGALADGLAALNQGLEQAEVSGLWQANEAALAFINQQIEALQLDPAANAAEIQRLMQLSGLISANHELLTGIRDGIAGDGTAANPGLAAGAAALKAQYTQFDASIQALPAMLGQLAGSLAELKDGIDRLALGYDEFHGGLSESAGGAAALFDGFRQLCAGFSVLVDGAKDLSEGASALSGGMNGLAEGTGRLADGTGSIEQEIQKRVDEVLAPYMSSGQRDMVSFISDRNTHVSLVQFIMSTDAVGMETIPDTPKPENEKKNFWQRFLALFGL